MNRKNITTDDAHYFLTDEFSQWYPSKFKDEKGIEFNCAEQWMMYSKAEFFGDHESMAKILATDDPDEMKKLGRGVKNYDDDAWSYHAPTVVAVGNIMKFSQNPELWEILDNTENKKLVEAASYDKIWGVGLKAEDAIKTPESEWLGTNNLGKAIMEARDLIRHTPQIIVKQKSEEKRVFSFYDEQGQRNIRLNIVELCEKMNTTQEALKHTLMTLTDSEISLEYKPFVKESMKASKESLLNSLVNLENDCLNKNKMKY
jgi:ribA/ribD-fused uncharacterized protein